MDQGPLHAPVGACSTPADRCSVAAQMHTTFARAAARIGVCAAALAVAACGSENDAPTPQEASAAMSDYRARAVPIVDDYVRLVEPLFDADDCGTYRGTRRLRRAAQEAISLGRESLELPMPPPLRLEQMDLERALIDGARALTDIASASNAARCDDTAAGIKTLNETLDTVARWRRAVRRVCRTLRCDSRY